MNIKKTVDSGVAEERRPQTYPIPAMSAVNGISNGGPMALGLFGFVVSDDVSRDAVVGSIITDYEAAGVGVTVINFMQEWKIAPGLIKARESAEAGLTELGEDYPQHEWSIWSTPRCTILGIPAYFLSSPYLVADLIRKNEYFHKVFLIIGVPDLVGDPKVGARSLRVLRQKLRYAAHAAGVAVILVTDARDSTLNNPATIKPRPNFVKGFTRFARRMDQIVYLGTDGGDSNSPRWLSAPLNGDGCHELVWVDAERARIRSVGKPDEFFTVCGDRFELTPQAESLGLRTAGQVADFIECGEHNARLRQRLQNELMTGSSSSEEAPHG